MSQPQTNASSPAGSLFGRGNSDPAQQQSQGTDNSNNQQANGGNIPEPSENDRIEQLASRLTSGAVISDNDPEPSGNKDTNTNPQPQFNDTSGDNKGNSRDDVIAQLMQPFKGDTITGEINMEELGQSLANGDLQGVVDLVENTAQNAVKRATETMLNLIPEIIKSAENRIMQSVNNNNEKDGVWNRFVTEYPDYAPHKGSVREHIEKAIQGGADEQQAFAAVDMIFGNLKKSTKDTKASAHGFDIDSENDAFDLTQYGQ